MHQLLSSTDHTTVYVTSATEIIKAMLIFAGTLVAAGLGVGIPVRRKAKRERAVARQQQSEIHHSVVNTHSTILRDDVDVIRSLVQKVVRRQDRQSSDMGVIKKAAADAQEAARAAAEAAALAKNAAEAALAAVAENDKRLTDHIDGRTNGR